MRNFFLKHCHTYRKLINKLFGKYDVEFISIPMGFYGNFNYHYLGYDETGLVKKGFKNIIEAIRNRENLGLTVLYDKY